MDDLPTIEQCQAFRDKINEGRALIDLAPLEYIDFDGANPGATHNCLSARNLYSLAGFEVGTQTLCCPDPDRKPDKRVTKLNSSPYLIPEEILTVTDYFDACWRGSDDLNKLRNRMVEAGVVKPKGD
jgi:hypothetical protein